MRVEDIINDMPVGQMFRFHSPRYPRGYDMIMVHIGGGVVSVAYDLTPVLGPGVKIYPADSLNDNGVIIPMTADEAIAHSMKVLMLGTDGR